MTVQFEKFFSEFSLLASVVLLIWIVNQLVLLPVILTYLRKKIDSAIKEKREDLERENSKESKIILGKLDDDLGSESFIEYRSDKLGIITRTVGTLEILFFSIITYFSTEPVSSLAALGVWLGIKTATNHDQWSHIIVGKAYYYRSLLGTVINISLPIIVIIAMKTVLEISK